MNEYIRIGYNSSFCGILLLFCENFEFSGTNHILSNMISTMCILPGAQLPESVQRIIKYDRQQLFSIGQLSPIKLNPNVLSTLKQLAILKCKTSRGVRGGKSNQMRSWDYNQGVHNHNLQTLPEETLSNMITM